MPLFAQQDSKRVFASGRDVLLVDTSQPLPAAERVTHLQVDPDIWAAACSPDGTVAVASNVSGDQSIITLCNTDGSVRDVLVMLNNVRVQRLIFSSDGATLAAMNPESVVLWNVHDQKKIRELRCEDDTPDYPGAFFTAKDTVVITVGQKACYFWDATTGERKQRIEHSRDTVWYMPVLSPDSKTLAVLDTGTTKRIAFHDAATGELKSHFEGARGIVFAPSGAVVATWSRNAPTTITLRDATSLAPGPLLDGHTHEVHGATFSPDSATLASWSENGEVILWNVATRGTVLHATRGESITRNGMACHARFSPAGDVLAVWHGTEGANPPYAATLWNVATDKKEELKNSKASKSSGLIAVFSTDGSMLCTLNALDDNKKQAFWHSTGTRPAKRLPGHVGAAVSAVAIASDGCSVAAAFTDGAVFVWNATTGDEKARFACVPADSLAFADDGATVSGTSQGQTVFTVPTHTSTHAPPRVPEQGLPSVQLEQLRIDRRSAPLGAGGTAEVFEVLEPYGGVVCVAKLYYDNVLEKAAGRDMLFSAAPHHPHIVGVRAKIVDGNEESVRGLLLERMFGGTLARSLENGNARAPPPGARWPPLVRLQVAHDIATAVAFAHVQEVVHSDIKPENIMLGQLPERDDRDGNTQARLTDFGSGAFMAALGARSTVCGTLAFMAPERTGSPFKKDVFAFGMTLWHLFNPGQDTGLAEGPWVRDDLRDGKRPPLDDETVPSLVTDLIEECWDHDPANRPTMEAVVQKLDVVRRNLRTVNAGKRPSNPLWDILGQRQLDADAAQLQWEERDGVYYVEAPEDSACFRFAAAQFGDHSSLPPIKRIVMVQRSDTSVFERAHRGGAPRAAAEPRSRPATPTDDETAAMKQLNKAFADPEPSQPQCGRVVLVWHATRGESCKAVCRKGPHESLDGFVGAGRYFALEAVHEARHVHCNEAGERGLILYAMSVSRTYVVTPDRDNLPDVRCSRGDVCQSDPQEADPVRSYDTFFVPVRGSQGCHSDDPTGYEACRAAEAEAHVLVAHNSSRLTPIAIVYC